MSQAFQMMNSSLEKNLRSVNKHIKEVQKGELNSQTPQLEPLSDILGQISQKIGKQIYSNVVSQGLKSKFISKDDKEKKEVIVIEE